MSSTPTKETAPALLQQLADFKAAGNAAFQKGDMTAAKEAYTQGINTLPDHEETAALYSNRSFILAAKEEFNTIIENCRLALSDAENAIRLKPHWEKGHCRKVKALELLAKRMEGPSKEKQEFLVQAKAALEVALKVNSSCTTDYFGSAHGEFLSRAISSCGELSPWDLLSLFDEKTNAAVVGQQPRPLVLLEFDPSTRTWTAYHPPPPCTSNDIPPPELVLSISPEEIHRRGYLKVYPKYQVRPSKHGLGMFALEDIAPAEVILREASILRGPVGLNREAGIILACLHNALPTLGSFCGRISTNSFANAGICPIMSHVNHSCAPNAMFMWEENQGLEFLWATEPIASGEEIFVCYTSEYDTFSTRAKRLAAEKGIERCDCKLCTSSAEERKASDKELLFLKESDELLLAIGRQMSCSQALPTVLERAEKVEEICLRHSHQHYHLQQVFHDVCQHIGHAAKENPQKRKFYTKAYWKPYTKKLVQAIERASPPDYNPHLLKKARSWSAGSPEQFFF